MIQTTTVDTRVRPLDVRKDLLPVADLIETCFGPHLDPDGHLYLSQIREAARDPRRVRWTYAAGELVSYPLNGYVCEVAGQVVGNLSLIPLYWKRRWRYLIANVAVHNDFRRQGIARQLTEKALEHVRRRPIDSVWLHVREDNHAAINLYRQFDFIARCRRDTWISRDPYPARLPTGAGLSCGPCRPQDWRLQQRWLATAYPPEVAWHMPLDIARYRLDLLNVLRLVLEGKRNLVWCARRSGDLVGTAILDQGFSRVDQVYLGAQPGQENDAIPILLSYIKENFAPGRQLAVNFPAYQARPAFETAGFQLLNTLIWMEIRINE